MSHTPSDRTRESLFNEFNSVVAETEKLFRSVAASGSDEAGAVRAKVEQGLATAADLLERLRREAVGQASAAARATDEYVVESPWRAIGIAAVVAGLAGLVAGLLVSNQSLKD